MSDHDLDSQPVLGQMGSSRMRPVDEADNARPWTFNDVQYAAYGVYSQVRQIRDELVSGQLRVRDVPTRLRIAMTKPVRDDDNDTQEML